MTEGRLPKRFAPRAPAEPEPPRPAAPVERTEVEQRVHEASRLLPAVLASLPAPVTLLLEGGASGAHRWTTHRVAPRPGLITDVEGICNATLTAALSVEEYAQIVRGEKPIPKASPLVRASGEVFALGPSTIIYRGSIAHVLSNLSLTLVDVTMEAP